MSKNKAIPLRFRALLTSATVATLVLFGVAAPAQAANVGGVNVAQYCKVNIKSGFPFTASKAVNTTNTWYGWGCATRWGVQWVNMNLACAQQHPGSVARHGTGMYSWWCSR